MSLPPDSPPPPPPGPALPPGAPGHAPAGTLLAEVDPLQIFFHYNWPVTALYALVMAASLAANSLLIFVVVKFQYMRSVTNIFLVNLSVADLLVTLFCMPAQISASVTVLWYFGEAMCKCVNFLQCVAVASSVFTITAMSVDRYLAIMQALRTPWAPSRRGALALLAALWAVAMVIFSPLLLVSATRREVVTVLRVDEMGRNVSRQQHFEFCGEAWPDSMRRELFGAATFVLVYAVPGSVVVVAYTLMGRRLCAQRPPGELDGRAAGQQRQRVVRERRRVARTLLLLAALFAACWLPYSVLQLLLDLGVPAHRLVGAVLPFALLLGHANSAINPIVYCLMMRNFRRSLRVLFCPEYRHSASARLHLQSLGKQSTASDKTRSTLLARSDSRLACAPPHLRAGGPRASLVVAQGAQAAQAAQAARRERSPFL